MIRTCRHCKQPYPSRVGRGLCSKCFKDISIRELYPLVAPFGGAEASKVWEQQKVLRSHTDEPQPQTKE